MRPQLKYRPDGTFTIVQFTDVHWKNGEAEDARSLALMASVLDEERPDLVMITGDQIHSGYCTNALESYRQSLAAILERELPWAAVFGNHDDEQGATREQLLQVQQESPFCLTERGPDHIAGVGNFVLTIAGADGRTQAAVYGLDSGAYREGCPEEYGWIKRSQIDWYAQESARLTSENGAPVPALAFFHIPLPEYREVWDTGVCYGARWEGVCSPKLNSGFFTALVECGDVMGTFVGHDHVNDYWGEQHGIRLCYGRATGYNTYGREGFPRGARVIRLHEGRHSFDTWLRLDGGAVIREQEEHQPVDTK